MSALIQVVIIFLSSLITLALAYFKVSVTTYQQILILIMVLGLIFYNRIFAGSETSKKISGSIVVLAILFVASLFVQLLVISTGALFSPFLILLHLFSMGASFLINVKASLSFVIFALISLSFYSYLNASQLALIRDDIGTVLLYLVSFLVIIPLSHVITKRYHIKDELSNILTKQVKIGESILESLSELVLITDENLKIISVNEAVKKILSINDSDFNNKLLLDVINLKDINGNKATQESLSISQVLSDKQTRILRDLYLFTPQKVFPHPVTVQIRPIINAEGIVDQLSIVINEGRGIVGKSPHKDLDQALVNQKIRLESLKKTLLNYGLTDLEAQVELLDKTEKDILIAEELEDESINEETKLLDLAEICQQVITQKQNFAKALKVRLDFSLAEKEIKELTLLQLKKQMPDKATLPISSFTVPSNEKWLKILIEKIIDIATLICVGEQNPAVTLTLEKTNDERVIHILISSTHPLLESQKEFLFEKYYPALIQTTKLGLGSGLEGYICKTILTRLNLSLNFKFRTNQTIFVLTLSKLTS